MTPGELIARAADGTLTPDEAAQLTAACRADAEVRRAFTRQMATERLLHAVERDPLGHSAAQEIVLRLEQERVAAVSAPGFALRVVESARRRVWLPRFAAAAAIALLAGVAVFFFKKMPPVPEVPFAADGPPSQRAESAAPVAVLKRVVGVEWASPQDSRAVGTMLSAGWLRLRAGTVQVEFLGGARLLVTGPAELRLDADDAAFLQSGKASAYVPEPARGFKLHTPGVAIVDLGTAFGVDVSGGHAPEVHVFDGAVTLAPTVSKDAPQILEAGHAARLDGAVMRGIPVRPADFPNGEALARSADAAGRARAKEWKTAVAALAAEPATLLSYTLDADAESSRTVTNRAAQAAAESAGALVGAGWTGGRWPGKRALEFRSLGDRLRFTVPGAHRAITLLTWVRVDSLPNDYNALLMPSHYQAGSLHWQIERGGELRLTLRNTDTHSNHTEDWDGPVSGPAVSNMDFGRWLFLATTYDSATGLVTHYRDGQPCGSGRFAHRLPAVLGPVEFGNWGADSASPDTAWTRAEPPKRRTRNFVGRLDELTILARALAAEEIARLYQIGMP